MMASSHSGVNAIAQRLHALTLPRLPNRTLVERVRVTVGKHPKMMLSEASRKLARKIILRIRFVYLVEATA